MSANYERKQKQRSIMGITAGAEDVKYQAKYRELKKKVKEIESVSHALYGLSTCIPHLGVLGQRPAVFQTSTRQKEHSSDES